MVGLGWAVPHQEGPHVLLVGLCKDATHYMALSPWASLLCALVSLAEMGDVCAPSSVCCCHSA